MSYPPATGSLPHAEVQRLTLRPGDRIVIRYPFHLPEVTKYLAAQNARRDLGLPPDTPLLVLDDGAAVTVLTQDGAGGAASGEEAALDAYREAERRGLTLQGRIRAALKAAAAVAAEREAGHSA